MTDDPTTLSPELQALIERVRAYDVPLAEALSTAARQLAARLAAAKHEALATALLERKELDGPTATALIARHVQPLAPTDRPWRCRPSRSLPL